MIILIDNGHGEDTPGKCSPGGKLKEWSYTREVARYVTLALRERGYDARRIVLESNDVPLWQRTRRVNNICDEVGKDNVILVSIHLNAAGVDNKWHNARGFSVFVAPKASNNSKTLARAIYDTADAAGLRGNRSVPPQRYWVQNLAICRDTKCPAVLAECLFMDNREDCKFLLSPGGQPTVISVITNGIINYLEKEK